MSLFEGYTNNFIFEDDVFHCFKILMEIPIDFNNQQQVKYALNTLDTCALMLIERIYHYKIHNAEIPQLEEGEFSHQLKPLYCSYDNIDFGIMLKLFEHLNFKYGNNVVIPKVFVDKNLYDSCCYGMNNDWFITRLLIYTVLRNMLRFGYCFSEPEDKNNYYIPIELYLDEDTLNIACFSINSDEDYKKHYYESIKYYCKMLKTDFNYKLVERGELEVATLNIPKNEVITPYQKVLTPEYFSKYDGS